MGVCVGGASTSGPGAGSGLFPGDAWRRPSSGVHTEQGTLSAPQRPYLGPEARGRAGGLAEGETAAAGLLGELDHRLAQPGLPVPLGTLPALLALESSVRRPVRSPQWRVSRRFRGGLEGGAPLVVHSAFRISHFTLRIGTLDNPPPFWQSMMASWARVR
jgi:hypothetical protein